MHPSDDNEEEEEEEGKKTQLRKMMDDGGDDDCDDRVGDGLKSGDEMKTKISMEALFRSKR